VVAWTRLYAEVAKGGNLADELPAVVRDYTLFHLLVAFVCCRLTMRQLREWSSEAWPVAWRAAGAGVGRAERPPPGLAPPPGPGRGGGGAQSPAGGRGPPATSCRASRGRRSASAPCCGRSCTSSRAWAWTASAGRSGRSRCCSACSG